MKSSRESRPGRAASPTLLAAVLIVCGAPLQAQVVTLPDTVVVTGTVAPRPSDEAPFAISVIEADALRKAGPMINLSEALVQVPGLVVNNRSNYAQDLQISSRGFGARAGFGVRGVRLYADGIPASGPDGQGQVSHFDIAGARRVEVLRGPFSVLYGNSSGGVIALVGAAVTKREVEAGVDLGSFGLRQGRASLALPLSDALDLRASVSHLSLDGFRPQSAARKTQANARLGWQTARDTVTVLLSHLDQPADDPLGLSRAQFELGPDQTAAQALQFDTRKTTRQTQTGVSWQHRIEGSSLQHTQLAAYTGQRSVAQWLAIPVATQANPSHGGGVIAFDRDYAGLDARARWAWPASGLDLVAGLSIETQRDDRKGYDNFTGTGPATVLGVVGALRRDEINRAQTRDVYAQTEWKATPRLSLSAGLRSGQVKLSAQDAFLANGNDSGALDFRYTNPVFGLRFQAVPGLQLHASLARGFESPTLGELAYQANGTGGFNTGLQPQTSRQLELGAKWRQGPLALEATLFQVHTDDEIGVATNSGGRSAFQNVGRTQRRGAELGLGWRPSGPWRAQLALSTLDARYRDDFRVCAAIPCTAPTATVPAGNHIAGAPRGNAWAELAWAGGTWGEWALEARGLGRTAVNDRNTDFAAGHGLLGLRWTRSTPLGNAGSGGSRLEWLVRIDNLADRQHAGSVIVNDANGRFFEPGSPRSLLLALRVVGGL